MRRYLILVFILAILPLLGLSCINIKKTKTTDGGIFKSEDAAETWQQKVFVSQEKKETIAVNNETITKIVFHPQDRKIIYLGTRDNGLYRSADAGEKWTAFKPAGNYPGFSIDPTTPQIIYVSQGAKIDKTVDEGKTWENIYIEPNGKEIVSVNVDYYNPAQIWALSSAGDLLFSQDWGERWTVFYRLGVPTNNLVLNPQDTRVMYATAAKKGIWKSIDGGKQWSDILSVFATSKEKKGMYDLRYFTLVESDPNIIYIVTKNGIYRSFDAGANWEPLKTLQPAASVDINALAVNYENLEEIYFSIGKVIHKTINDGETWKTIETFPSSRTINQLVINPEDPKIIWAGTYLPLKKK